MAGPVKIQTSKRLIVECGSLSFFVSTVVDCQPPGPFDRPLYLDFRVGESDDAGDLDGVDRAEYKKFLRSSYEVRPPSYVELT